MEKLQPKLRFPEFKGDWVHNQIGDYIDLFSGIALKSDEISDDESGIPILRGINITEGYIRHTKEIDKYFLGDINKIKRYFVKENDLVLGMDGSKVGKNVALIRKEDENSILIQRVARIRANSKSNINFIYQHIFSKRFHDYVDVVNTSSGIPHISSQQIKEFKIGFTSVQEQSKIATFLSAVDEKLNLLKEKKALLEEYKKGMMQKIFSQELRFKDDTSTELSAGNGKDFADWEEKIFSEVFKAVASKKYQVKSSEIKEKGLFPVIDQGKDLIAGFSDDNNKIFKDF
jgi:type I restriction enzyme S subunit